MRVYIAYRYSCKGNVLDVLHSIGKATFIGKLVAELGAYPFIPHLDWLVCAMDGATGDNLPKGYYYEASMAFLEVCDCMLLVNPEDLEYSSGVKAEYDYCVLTDIPVFKGLNEFKQFMQRCEEEKHV